MVMGGSWINDDYYEYSDLDLYLLLLNEHQNITLNKKMQYLEELKFWKPNGAFQPTVCH